MDGKSAQLQLVKEVLTEFERKGIKYCLLRNYEFLLGTPDPFESLDTLIAVKDMPLAHQILIETGFTRRKQQFSLKHKAYFKFTEDSKWVSFDIQVGGIHWNDLPYLNEIVLQNRTKKSYFYAPSDNDTFVMLLVHSILGKRYFKPKYQNILASLIDNPQLDRRYVLGNLTRIFNRSTAVKLINLVKKRKFKEVPAYSLVFYFVFKRFNHLITFTKLFGRWVVWKKPLKPAPLISIVGPDGAGKSTMVNSLNDYLRANGRKTSVIYTGRGRGHILPISRIGRLYKSNEKKRDKERMEKKHEEPTAPPPNHPPLEEIKREEPKVEKNKGKDMDKNTNQNIKRKVLYTLIAPIFTLDLFLRYVFQIFPQRMKKKVVITDRYCSDIILMKNVPFQFKKLLLGLFPRPTISVFLYNSPEILHHRRPEEPIKELQRQLSIFPRLNYSLMIKTEDVEKDRKKMIGFVFGKLLYEWF